MLAPATVHARIVMCPGAAEQITAAVERIQRSIDPCSESAEIMEIFTRLERCTARTYEICINTQAARNEFDRRIGPRGQPLPRTITWNPELHTEIELGCDGDPTKPVRRDPTASLLHELVHAVQDCDGQNPGEHELEAVRIENIYRRAAGLCQRGGYGDLVLPRAMAISCSPGHCPCSKGLETHDGQLLRRADGRDTEPVAPLQGRTAADSSGDQPQ
ncbi:MAG: hypothetical protein AB7V27_08750 [Candidatus Binatia bacterium]